STPTPVWQTRYTLGPGDVLDISMYDRPDLKRENVRIGPDGTLSYLQAVAVQANGLNLDQFRRRLEHALGEYHVNPKIIISPAQIGSKSFAIIGRVQEPGNYTLDRPTTILEAVALAQGVQVGSVRGSAFELADFDRSFIARKGRKLGVDLSRLYYQGDLSQNAFLEPNDYVYIASNIENEIYVLGAVNNPGRFQTPQKLTLLRAIGEAGGFQDKAFRMRVLLIRGSIHNPETLIVNTRGILKGEQPDIDLQNGDIVYINLRPFEMVERVLDSALVTYVQTITAQATNTNFTPFSLR
ncbi:MAG: SLBB domain-containing protein, partial [Verrucomicrobiota bacterium]